jgi:fumarate reductase flavoprotein subunit
MNAEDADLIVVGGGLAGLTAANRAAQLGLRAVVLEKGAEEKYLCNTRYTGGTLHVCMDDIMAGESALLEAIQRLCAGIARPDLARAMARHAERAVRWLQGEGLKFLRASGSPHHRWVLAPPGRTRPGLDWEGRAGDVLLRRLGANLIERGGRLTRDARAVHALMEGRRCVGVAAQVAGAPTEFRAGSVVLADGGFQAAPELLREYITGHPEKLHQRNARTGTGDGVRIAEEAGAALLGMDRFYGHLLSIDAPTNDRLWPYPYLDALVTAGILVGPDGKRFADEGRGGVYAANSVAALADPHSAAVVFDQKIWEGAGCYGLIAANPHLRKEGGTLHEAASLSELAQRLGVPAAAFEATVADYSAAVDDGSIGALTPERRTDKGVPVAIRTPPFYAAPVCAGITYTMGGIAIDGHARVLRPDDSVVDGLYAAGATTGGLEGGPGVGYVGGLSKSAVTGLRAAEHAAGQPAD